MKKPVILCFFVVVSGCTSTEFREIEFVGVDPSELCKGGVVRPIVKGWYASKFGPRLDPSTQTSQMHTGVDYAGREGAPVYSVDEGIVLDIQHFENFSEVKVFSIEDVYFTYSHINNLTVSEGDVIKPGALLGHMAPTHGDNVVSFVHFEYRVLEGDFAVAKDPRDLTCK